MLQDAQCRFTLWQDGLSFLGWMPLRLRLKLCFEAEHSTNYGRVVERSITTVLKTVGSRGSVGSNPTSSSIFKGDNYDHRRILEMDSRKRTIAT